MTELLHSDIDLTSYEADFGDLALSADAQDLLFREAHTAYAFTDEPVTDEQLRAVYDLVKWAPTAMNSQPLRVVLVRSPEARERLVRHMGGNNQARVAAAPVTAILAADVDFHDELHRTFPVFPGARELFTGDDLARERSARFSAGLQAAYFLVGIRAAGLGAGPMTGFDAAGIDAEFFPDGAHRTLMVVNIGRTAADGGNRPRLPRLDYTDVVETV
ncbi:malonic semialdehyde reductase [Microlunatus ginsengisoli]|uniref:Malonic semialdehyde reductase n=1 Tax=Microlunatus ginsengisoli TaxID=363863 RepID=A0ABP7AUG7_9ACTN